MKKHTYWLLLLSGLGTCFAGYISLSRFITGTCPLSEPCPYFLGYPACWYGLAMFSLLFITSLMTYVNYLRIERATQIHLLISALGIAFAGYFTVPEVYAFLSGTTYTLGLPTCAYGLIFYVTIFILTVIKIRDIAASEIAIQ